ncbi:hypothetical protein TSOC_002750 [Tetrabaena socialis]|uniref:Uncharacterized protein n=1 Tax=Tetrabaena socialis TaxID=47790 RepID=A0A2J8ADB5_9CHLO|nr:hypothetical protein TSOC_002750 [Tetrabaena socialis]|eukprot:PNH10510.1 hypothetical protein TSOC_002750 [Tetrabaena socialis]
MPRYASPVTVFFSLLVGSLIAGCLLYSRQSTPQSAPIFHFSRTDFLATNSSRSFLYQNTSPCYDFTSEDFANKTRCETGVIPGAYWPSSSGAAPRTGRESVLYGTASAQQAIYAHQHPRDCRTAKFLVVHFSSHRHGLGSAIHMMSYGLATAMKMGRVYIHGAGAEAWTEGNTLCHPTSLLDECLLQPMSSCSLEDVMRGEMAPFTSELNPAKWHAHRVIQTKDIVGDFSSFPPTLRDMLANGPIPLGSENYTGSAACVVPFPDAAGNDAYAVQWWRAQSTSYVYRPIPRVLRAIREHMKTVFQAGVIPPGTIGVHVRRGDKEKESYDITDDEYLPRVEALHAASTAAGVPLKRTIYLSTEDNVTLAVFKSWDDWTVLHTDVPRYHEKISPMAFAAQMGVSEVILNDLVSLELALQCDAWMGSLSSGWVRLIHELRSTVRCKADLLFFDSRFGLNFTYTTGIASLW